MAGNFADSGGLAVSERRVVVELGTDLHGLARQYRMGSETHRCVRQCSVGRGKFCQSGTG